MGLDWDRPYGIVYGGFKAKDDQDGKYFDSHGVEMRVGETSKTLRFHKKILKPYLVGKGIDIGCGRGRPHLYGITRGFSSVTGLELSKELAQSCLMNISKVKKIQKHNITSSEVHVLNVKDFVFRDDHNVIYCFNTPEIIKMVMQN